MDVHCTESIPQSYFFSYVQRKLGFLNKNVYMSDVQCTYRASRDTTIYIIHVRRTTTQTYIQYMYVFGLLKRHLSNGRSTKVTVIKIHLYYCTSFFLCTQLLKSYLSYVRCMY